jgi:hypothetical protein
MYSPNQTLTCHEKRQRRFVLANSMARDSCMKAQRALKDFVFLDGPGSLEQSEIESPACNTA